MSEKLSRKRSRDDSEREEEVKADEVLKKVKEVAEDESEVAAGTVEPEVEAVDAAGAVSEEKEDQKDEKEPAVAKAENKGTHSTEGRASETKDTETKDTEIKDTEGKASETESTETKDTEGKASESETTEGKASETKATEDKNSEAKQPKDEKEKTTEDTKQAADKPKFVFGSTTAFGSSAFSLLNKKKNVFDSADTDKPTTAISSSTKSVFGSNSKFGNSFQSAITKESIFDKKEGEEAADNAKESEQKEEKEEPNKYKQIDLKETQVLSGEENEEQIFTARGKLYVLDLTNVKEGWKERGIGIIHVNKSKDLSKQSSRIIMRSIGLLKVILNTGLVKGLEVVKGMPSSLASEKFTRITSVEDGKPVQFAIKVGKPELANELYTSITSLLP